MKNRNLFLALIAIVFIGFTACNSGSSVSKAAKLESETDTIAYTLGHSIGNNLLSQFPGVDPALIAKGLMDGYNEVDNSCYATPQESDTAIRAYLQGESERKASANMEKGVTFLAENAKKDGIKVTDSGLQYEVITEGTGPKPSTESTVSVMYHGTTIDGVVFDSSVERGDTVSFPVTGVIKGWTEGLQLMPVGSKYKFYIPAELAYGTRGAGAKIGPNSTLIFDVELIDIK
ncbi:MAG: FKBP-type peptidyl-prolyl cis-trans isomerase [Prolixibacteraceae bacterium]